MKALTQALPSPDAPAQKAYKPVFQACSMPMEPRKRIANQEKLPRGALRARSQRECTARAHLPAGLPFVQVVLHLLLLVLPAVVILRRRMAGPAEALGRPPRPLHLEAAATTPTLLVRVHLWGEQFVTISMERCGAPPVTVEGFRENTEGPTPNMKLFTFCR